MKLNVSSMIGDLFPSVKFSKITLESVAHETNSVADEFLHAYRPGTQTPNVDPYSWSTKVSAAS